MDRKEGVKRDNYPRNQAKNSQFTFTILGGVKVEAHEG